MSHPASPTSSASARSSGTQRQDTRRRATETTHRDNTHRDNTQHTQRQPTQRRTHRDNTHREIHRDTQQRQHRGNTHREKYTTDLAPLAWRLRRCLSVNCILQQISHLGGPAVALSAVGASGRRCAIKMCFAANLSSRGSGGCVVGCSRLLAPLVGGALLGCVLQQISHLEGRVVALSAVGCWRLWSAVRYYNVFCSKSLI